MRTKSLPRLLLGGLAIASALAVAASLVAPAGTLALAALPAAAEVQQPNLAAVGAGDIPQALLADVLHTAAQQTGVVLADMTLIRAEATTWRNDALGCPLPGLVYGNEPIQGYWIVVDAAGELLDYRTGEHGQQRRCLAD